MKCRAIFFAAAALSAIAASPAFANGVIEGIIKVQAPVPTVPPQRVAKDAGVCGKTAASESVVVGKGGSLRNVVVSVTDAPFAGQLAPVAGAALDQKACRYRPHVQALTVGTPLSVMNDDAILHNVHANEAETTVFNVAMPIKGQKVPVQMRKPGLMRLQCDAGHVWMSGWIYVFAHPYFGVTDASGHFVIKDVPPGEHTLELWHEPVDGKGSGVKTTAKVKVTDGTPAHLDLAIKL